MAKEKEIDDLVINDQEKKQLPRDINADLLGRIAWQINNAGLTTREACVVIGFSSDRFHKAMGEFPFIQEIIDRKIIEYKKDLLQPLVDKAKEGNDRLAQWLLEKRFPDEFGTQQKINKMELEDSNIFAIALREIQKDSAGLISQESGKAFVIAKSKNKNIKEIIKNVHDILA